MVYDIKPSVEHLRVFGCLVFVLTPKELHRKWDPKLSSWATSSMVASASLVHRNPRTDSRTQPSADEDSDVESTRHSTRQRVDPVEWWCASANMAEAAICAN